MFLFLRVFFVFFFFFRIGITSSGDGERGVCALASGFNACFVLLSFINIGRSGIILNSTLARVLCCVKYRIWYSNGSGKCQKVTVWVALQRGHGRHLICIFFFFRSFVSLLFSPVFSHHNNSASILESMRSVCVLISNVSFVCCSCALYERAHSNQDLFWFVFFFCCFKHTHFPLLHHRRCSVLFALAYRLLFILSIFFG